MRVIAEGKYYLHQPHFQLSQSNLQEFLCGELTKWLRFPLISSPKLISRSKSGKSTTTSKLHNHWLRIIRIQVTITPDIKKANCRMFDVLLELCHLKPKNIRSEECVLILYVDFICAWMLLSHHGLETVGDRWTDFSKTNRNEGEMML